MLGEINYRILYHKTNKEASTELCSVVKYLGSGRALKKWGKTLDCVSCFPLHFFPALPLPACFTTEQSAVEASLFVNYQMNCCDTVQYTRTLVALRALLILGKKSKEAASIMQ